MADARKQNLTQRALDEEDEDNFDRDDEDFEHDSPTKTGAVRCFEL